MAVKTHHKGGLAAVRVGQGIEWLDPQAAADKIAAGEAAPVSEQDVTRHYFRDDPVLSAMLGAARGATLGASDVILTRSGIASPEEVKEYREESPWASGLGELGGAAASMLLPGGGLVGQVARVGRAAGTALSKVPLLGKLAPAAAEGAALGAAYGASEAAWDPDKKAKDILDHAAWGAGVGAGFGAIGLGVSRLAKFASKEVKNEAEAVGRGAYEESLARRRAEQEVKRLETENAAIEKQALGREEPLASPLAAPDELKVRSEIERVAYEAKELSSHKERLVEAAHGKPASVAEAVPAQADDAVYRQLHDKEYLRSQLAAEAKKLQEAIHAPSAVAAAPLAREAADKALLDVGQLKKQIATDREVASNLGDDLFGSVADPTRALSPEAYAAKRQADATLDDAIKEATAAATAIEKKIIRPLKKPRGDETGLKAELVENERALGGIKEKWRGYEIAQRRGASDETKAKIAAGQAESGITFRDLSEDSDRIIESIRRLRKFAAAEKLAKDPEARAQKLLEYAEALQEEVTLRAQRAGITRDISADLKSRVAAENARRIADRSPAQRAQLEQQYIAAQRRIVDASERVKSLEEQLKIREAAPPLDPAAARRRLDEVLPKLRALEEEKAALRSQMKDALAAQRPTIPRAEALQQLPLVAAREADLKAQLKALRKQLDDSADARARLAGLSGASKDALGPEARWYENDIRIKDLRARLGPAAVAEAAPKQNFISKLGGSALARIVARGVATGVGGATGGPVGAAVGWMVAPKTANALMGAVSGKAPSVVAGVVQSVGKGAGIAGKVGRPLKLPAITMTADEFADLRDELQAADPGQLEAEAWAAVPDSVDPEIAGKVITDAMARVQFLREKMPGGQESLGGPDRPSQEQLDAYARYIRASVDSNSPYEDFARGLTGEGPGVSKEAMEVAELLDAENLARARSVVASMLWRRKDNTVQQQQQIALFLGRPEIKGTVLQPYTAMVMNEMQAAKPPPPKAPGRPSRIGDRHMTSLEQLQGRA